MKKIIEKTTGFLDMIGNEMIRILAVVFNTLKPKFASFTTTIFTQFSKNQKIRIVISRIHQIITKFSKQILSNIKKNSKKYLIIFTTILSISLIWIVISQYNSIPRLHAGKGDGLYSMENKLYSADLGTTGGTPKISFGVREAVADFTLVGSKNSGEVKKINSQTVLFEEVLPQTDLKYTTLENGLKEEIIIKSPPSDNSALNHTYLFDFNLSGAIPKVLTSRPDGVINIDPTFTDESGKYLFHFEQPFAVDDSGARTDNVLLQIGEDRSNPGKYYLKLTVDEKWLNSPERIFPISIDPTIVHDTSAEFSPGQLNRNKDTGSGSFPSIETYYQELPADEHTVGLWHMNEASGNVLDSSGNSNTGTPTGTTVVDGKLNNGRSFNGTSDYVYSSTSMAIPTGDFTYEAWIKPDTTNDEMIFMASDGTGANEFYIILSSTNKLAVATNNTVRLTTTNTINTDWQHIAITRSGSTITAYIDGIADPTIGTDATVMSFGSCGLLIGSDANATCNTTLGNWFDGSIDEVRVSNIARTPEEIKVAASRRPYSVYTSEVIDLTSGTSTVNSWNSLSWDEWGIATGDGETLKDSTGLVAQWNFNETSGTIADNAEGTTVLDGTLNNFHDTSGQDQTPTHVAATHATGGTITYADGYIIHTFTSSGTFTPSISINVETLVVAGGGGGGGDNGGGGGAGGVVYSNSLPITAQGYSVTVGGGGNYGVINTDSGTNGGNSVFSTITAIGGGYGGTGDAAARAPGSGGSGGGGQGERTTSAGGAGTAGQGYAGGTAATDGAGGGGGASEVGANGVVAVGGVGGDGVAYSISGTSKYYGGGGGGGNANSDCTAHAGGLGGGGASACLTAVSGTANTGGGGGGATYDGSATGGSGGSGIVIIRYPDTPSGWTADNKRWGAGALQFDGHASYISVSDDTALDLTNAITVETWINPKDVDDKVIISKRDTSPGSDYSWELSIGTAASGSLPLFRINDNANQAVGLTSLSTSQGYIHLVGVYDSSAGGTDEIKIYINGKLSGTGDYSTAISTNNTNVSIGKRIHTGSEAYFNGTIDSTRIYSRALTPAEIMSNYNVGNIQLQTRVGTDTSPDDGSWDDWSPTTGETVIEDFDSDATNWSWDNTATYMPQAKSDESVLKMLGTGSLKQILGQPQVDADTVALWHLDETNGNNTGDDVFDATSNNNDGEFIGTNIATAVVDGISNKAREFNGTDDYISTSYGNGINPSTNPYTYSAWIKSNDPSAAKMWLVQGNWSTPSRAYFGHTGGYWSMGIQASGWGETTGGAADQNWHYVSIVFDGLNAKFYLDGAYVYQKSYTSFTFNQDLMIGSGRPTDPQYDWDGSIDEVKISNVARSAEEIAEAYRLGRDHYLNRTIASTDLSGKNSLPFYIAADKPGTYLNATIGESAYDNYQPDANTVGLWHLDESTAAASEGDESTPAASGGTVTYADGYTIHTFTSSGTFTPSISINVETLVVAGGGGGGGDDGGGGGAGGVVYSNSLPITAQGYSVTVGGGGNYGVINTDSGTNGGNSVFSTITAIGGGYGGTGDAAAREAGNGGSGGGGQGELGRNGGTGTAGQGYDGGDGSAAGGAGGGGGASEVGGNGGATFGAAGGDGTSTYSDLLEAANAGVESGGTYYIAGGGGGGNSNTITTPLAAGGKGGGGAAGYGTAVSGTANTGGGAGGGTYNGTTAIGGTGGSGIVIIRYPTMTLKDASGNGNDGTPIGTTYTQGKIGKAREFNGTSDYISVPSSSIPSGNEITISFWAYGGDTLGSVNNSIFEANDSSGNRTCNIHLPWSNGNVYWDCGNSGTLYNRIYKAADTSDYKGKWTHWAFTKNATAGTLKIYLNGILWHSGAGLTYPINTGGVASIGSYAEGVAPYWPGKLDEFRIDNTARTPSDIHQAYEVGLRTHPITIDFAASGDSGNLITGSGDLGFTIDATAYGLDAKGSSLYKGDKVIVRENYDGTSYIAQGTVTAVTASTGAVTISAWDTGSTFPSAGYTANADIFKWQREYWPIADNTLSTHMDAITNLTLRLTDGNEGRTIWLDDLKSTSGYLTTPGGSTITSSIGNQYMQYRAIITSLDEAVSATLSAVTLDYTANIAPNTPSLDVPTDTTTNQSLLPVLKTTGTDTESDYLRYKIELCEDVGMSTSCQTFTQPSGSPQTGWSGQDAQTSTAYTSGTQATYTLQTPLAANDTYYWRSYAIDPGGANIWSNTQTPYSFTTTTTPTAPTTPYAEDATNPSGITDLTPEFSAIHNDPDSDSADYYQIEVDTQVGFDGVEMWDSGKQSMTTTADGVRSPDISYAGSTLSFDSSTYYWRIKFWDINGAESAVSATQNFTMNIAPVTPSLDLPTDTASDQTVLPILKTTTTDTDSDYLRYKIELCEDVGMSTSCQTFDQTSSQTGWSGQDTQTSTAYTSGTQGVYTLQSVLDTSTTYYWRSYAIDPGGTNTWSSTQGTPYSFTTTGTPIRQSDCRISEASDDSQNTLLWTDAATNEDYYRVDRSTDAAAWSTLSSTIAADSTSYVDSTITTGHTYYYRITPYLTAGPTYGDWCYTETLTQNLGSFRLD